MYDNALLKQTNRERMPKYSSCIAHRKTPKKLVNYII